MISGLSLSAAACSAATSPTARNALSCLRKSTLAAFNETMAVEIVCGLERDERAHAHHDRAEHLIVNVKVVVSEAAACLGDDAVIGIPGGIFRHRDAEGRSDFHAFENKIDAVVIFSHHAALPAQDKVLLADALLGPRDGDAVIAGKSLNPALVAIGALA